MHRHFIGFGFQISTRRRTLFRKCESTCAFVIISVSLTQKKTEICFLFIPAAQELVKTPTSDLWSHQVPFINQHFWKHFKHAWYVKQSAGSFSESFEWFGHLRSRRMNELYNAHALLLSQTHISSFCLPPVKPSVSPYVPVWRQDKTHLPLNLFSALCSGCLAESVCIYFKQPESVVWFIFFFYFLFLLVFPIFFFKLLLWDFPSLVYIFRFYKEQILSLKFSYFDWWGFGKGAGLVDWVI